jgi:hypothetical protein
MKHNQNTLGSASDADDIAVGERGCEGCMALERQYYFLAPFGGVCRIALDYTAADRVLRLMASARWWLARGNGGNARFAATSARRLRREQFPAPQRREQPLEGRAA